MCNMLQRLRLYHSGGLVLLNLFRRKKKNDKLKLSELLDDL